MFLKRLCCALRRTPTGLMCMNKRTQVTFIFVALRLFVFRTVNHICYLFVFLSLFPSFLPRMVKRKARSFCFHGFRFKRFFCSTYFLESSVGNFNFVRPPLFMFSFCMVSPELTGLRSSGGGFSNVRYRAKTFRV